MEILDTAGSEEYSAMRRAYVAKADAFLVTVSCQEDEMMAREILEMLEDQCKRRPLPVVMVASKSDANDPHNQAIAMRLARRYGCEWMSCSARTGEKVNDVFELATRMALFHILEMGATVQEEKKRSKCSVM